MALGNRIDSPAPSASALRADARRNLERILAAARDVFVESGADAPLDEVARRAGVGIATLYRRFPDRESLVRAVALEVLGRAGEEARRAEAEEADPFAALARYLHRALDLRISAVMPALVGRISFEDEEIGRVRRAAVEPFLRLIEAAQADRSLRSDVAFADIGTLLVRLSRPLPGPVPGEVDATLAHRQLDLLLDGLRGDARPGRATLAGRGLSLADLQGLGRTTRRPDAR